MLPKDVLEISAPASHIYVSIRGADNEKRHHGEHRDHSTGHEAGRRRLAVDTGDQPEIQAASQDRLQADWHPVDNVRGGAEGGAVQHKDVQAETWNRYQWHIQVPIGDEEDGQSVLKGTL